jgi:hypothetical protein
MQGAFIWSLGGNNVPILDKARYVYKPEESFPVGLIVVVLVPGLEHFLTRFFS